LTNVAKPSHQRNDQSPRALRFGQFRNISNEGKIKKNNIGNNTQKDRNFHVDRSTEKQIIGKSTNLDGLKVGKLEIEFVPILIGLMLVQFEHYLPT